MNIYNINIFDIVHYIKRTRHTISLDGAVRNLNKLTINTPKQFLHQLSNNHLIIITD